MQARARKANRRKTNLRNLVLGAIGVASAPLVYNYLVVFLSTDPFIGINKKPAHPIADVIGIRMDAVELRDFDGARLVSSAYADRVDVRKDRRFATLYGVHNGLFRRDKDTIRYSANSATWNLQTKEITVNKRIEIKSKDMNLQATSLTFDDRTSLLRVKGDVSGQIFKGDLVATSLVYNMKTGAADAGPVEWKGEIALSPQDDDSSKPHKWDIKGSHWKSLGSNSDILLYDNATAADGDLIIVAPKVQQNRKTDVLTAEGGIEYYSGKADIKADKCVVYRKEKRVVLTGHVIMFVKPKAQQDDPPKIEKLPEFKPTTPNKVVATHSDKVLTQDEQKEKEEELRSSKNLREFPLIVVSTQTEYWYGKGTRHAVITGSPQGRQALKDDEWRHIWSYSAFYDGEKETLKLFSAEKRRDALMKNSLGDHMEAVDILVSTKEDDDYIEGNDGRGSIYTSSDDIPKDEKKKATPPPTKGSGQTGG